MAKWCHMVTQINIGSGNGLSFIAWWTKPFPDPMLTYHQWGPVTIACGWIRKGYLMQPSINEISLEATCLKFKYLSFLNTWKDALLALLVQGIYVHGWTYSGHTSLLPIIIHATWSNLFQVFYYIFLTRFHRQSSADDCKSSADDCNT